MTNTKKLENHPQYAASVRRWVKSRLAVAGDDAIKTSAEKKKIVPMLIGQQDSQYEAMLNRATYFNATGRTLEGLLGMVFRKPVIASVPQSMQFIIEDMTLCKDDKESITDFAANLLKEDLTVGRVGVLIERPNFSTEGMTTAQVERLNLRPYCSVYPAESIVDWRYDRVNNATQLVMVRLFENVEEWVNEYEREFIAQERRLLLIDGIYVQRIFRDELQFGGDVVPTMRGKPLDYIPFVCDFYCEKPPLLDLAELNLSHFRTDVDREHGAHITAVPTPMFAGFQFAEGEVFNLGASGGYSSVDPQASWGFLEFQGQGLGTLKEIKEEKQDQMAILGARFLAAEKNQVEATKTVQIRKSGETSVLAKISQKRSRSLKRILEIMRDWMGVNGDVSAVLNSDYTEAGLDPPALTALVSAWQQGAISEQTLFYNLQHGEMFEDGVTFEDEQARISSQGFGAPIDQII